MVVRDETGPVRSIRRGRGEPLVLIHPFTTNARIWRGVANHLEDEFDILMVTLPGHYGADPASFAGMAVPRLVDHVEAAMDEAGWGTAHIAGNSLGGWIALELGRRGRARTVTAIAPAGGWGRVDLLRTVPVLATFLAIAPLTLLGRLAEPLVRERALVHRLMLTLVSGDRADAVQAVDAVSMLRASTHCPGYLKVLGNGALHGGMRDLGEVHVPVRLVLCEKDRIIAPKTFGVLFEQLLPDCHTITLEGLGHVPMLEAPELVGDVISEHARRHGLRVAS